METNIPPSQVIRLRREAIPEVDHTENKLWILERRNNLSSPWTALYCFEDNVCFLPQDFEVMNYFTSTHRTSVFTYRVLCSKYLLADEDESSIVGEIVLHEDKVYQTIGGVRKNLKELQTEQDRVDALYRYLGVSLSPAQVHGITGMATEIRTSGNPSV